MEKETFVQCRNEILDVFVNRNVRDWTSQIKILASAMNEILNPIGLQSQTKISDFPIFESLNERR